MIAVNSLSLLMITSSLISFFLFGYAFKRRNDTSIFDLSLLLLGATFWSFFYGVELAFTNLELMGFTDFFQYLGISTLPVLWLLFSARYSGNDTWISPIKSLLLFMVPIVTIIAVSTNDLHHLFYKTIELKNTSGFVHRELVHGVFWWIHVVYSHILVVAGAFFILSMVFRVSRINKIRVVFLLIGAIVPYVFNVAYVVGVMPLGFLDLTPISFILMGIVLSIGLFTVKLFDMTPMVQGKLFDNIPDAVFFLDTDYEIINVNPKAKVLMMTQFGGIQMNQKIEIVSQIKEHLLKKSKDSDFSVGNVFFDISSSEIQNHSNVKIGYLIILRDVTDRKLAEHERSQSDENYRLIAENSSDIIWTMDLYGNYHYVSPSVFNMLGYTAEENIKQKITENLTPDSLNTAMGMINFAMENILNGVKVEPHTVELQQYHKNGQLIWTEVVISPMYGKGTDFQYFLGVTRDITSRKKIETDLIAAKEKAEESDRLKTAFLANMSHEIRTPMNGILGFLELLKSIDLTTEQKDKYIDIIAQSGNRLLDTINDIIEISKIESGQLPVQLSDVNIETLIDFHYQFFKQQADSKGIELKLDCNIQNSKGFVLTDKHKINGILTNLIRNAIKFTNQGAVVVGNYMENDSIVFYVKDTGIGIPSDRLEAIFDRFVQADINNNRPYEGSGLGLSIVKAYVELLDGEIWVESKVEQGSIFYFSIPFHKSLIEMPSVQAILKNTKIANNAKIKLLIAEDHEISFILLQELLQNEQIEIVRATNGLECLNIFKQQNDFSLILMDMKMPIMDGFEAVQKIRAINPTIPIIAQTAYVFSGDKERAFAAGCNEVITKPIDKNALMAMIASITA